MADQSAALAYHRKFRGKIGTQVLSPITTKEELSLAYTPGVAEASLAIAHNPETVFDLTIKPHTVAVVTDGSAVLGLGNIGPLAALPVMEGKCALFKTFAGLDAFPICLATQEPSEIIKTVRAISPVFGGINLEDIAAPRCFTVEAGLQDLGIPVMHDDQHGTAVVVLAALLNAAKVVGKELGQMRVVIGGSGAAGSAIARFLLGQVAGITLVDSRGIVCRTRSDLDENKKQLADVTNPRPAHGGLAEALSGAHVFIGVSKPGIITPDMIRSMAPGPIIFALANPVPEIMPQEALAAGAAIVASGRSDFPNQVNNSLAFPGIFKGALVARAARITPQMKLAAAKAIASMVPTPTAGEIVPGPFTPGLVEMVSRAVAAAVA